MQDALMHAVKSVSLWANTAREAGATPEQLHAANVWTLRSVFSTLTNVNFSEERIAEYIQEGMVIKRELENLVPSSSVPKGPVAEMDVLGKSLQDLEDFGHSVSIPVRQAAMGDEDCFSLTEIGTLHLIFLCGLSTTYCLRFFSLLDKYLIQKALMEQKVRT